MEMARIAAEMGDAVYLRSAADRTYGYNVRRPTGIIDLDVELGGGFPAGSINQLYGEEGAGKNLVMNYAMAEVQRHYGDEAGILYVPMEYGLDKPFAWHCKVACPLSGPELRSYLEDGGFDGVDDLPPDDLDMLTRKVGELYVVDTGKKGADIAAEAKFEAALQALSTGLFQLICIDGLGAFLAKDQRFEKEGKRRRLYKGGKIGSNSMLLTRFLGDAFTLLGTPDSNGGPNQTTVLLNCQQRANIVDNPYAAKFAKKRKPVDSMALLHAKAIDVHLKKLKALKREIKGRKRLVGRLTGWEIVKGKLGSHDGPEGEFEHYFATGIHFLKEAIDAGKARGVLISRGSKYYGPWGEKGKSRADMEAYYDEGPEQQQRLDELRDACFQQAGLRVRFR